MMRKILVYLLAIMFIVIAFYSYHYISYYIQWKKAGSPTLPKCQPGKICTTDITN